MKLENILELSKNDTKFLTQLVNDNAEFFIHLRMPEWAKLRETIKEQQNIHFIRAFMQHPQLSTLFLGFSPTSFGPARDKSPEKVIEWFIKEGTSEMASLILVQYGKMHAMATTPENQHFLTTKYIYPAISAAFAKDMAVYEKTFTFSSEGFSALSFEALIMIDRLGQNSVITTTAREILLNKSHLPQYLNHLVDMSQDVEYPANEKQSNDKREQVTNHAENPLIGPYMLVRPDNRDGSVVIDLNNFVDKKQFIKELYNKKQNNHKTDAVVELTEHEQFAKTSVGVLTKLYNSSKAKLKVSCEEIVGLTWDNPNFNNFVGKIRDLKFKQDLITTLQKLIITPEKVNTQPNITNNNTKTMDQVVSNLEKLPTTQLQQQAMLDNAATQIDQMLEPTAETSAEQDITNDQSMQIVHNI